MARDPIPPTLEALLQRWQETSAQGQELAPELLCQDCPELLPRLKQRIDELRPMHAATDSAPGFRPRSETHRIPPDQRSDEVSRPLPVAGSFPAVPGYEIVQELGRGGMGVVYKARQDALNRFVALKMVLAGRMADFRDQVRFLREAEIIAALHHPQIVQIYEFGVHEGTPFFSLEFLEGGSLAARLAGSPQQPLDAARTVASLARVMQFAHEQGVIHRDLKPGNILLTADGTVKVGDFGLARRLESGLTTTGAVLGTPSYMAPEQTTGNAQAVGPLADVYSLGAILYEMLTGRPPFNAANSWEIVQMVVLTEAVPPRYLQPGVPRDLETICLKCLQKDPGARYRSALELAEDLHRFQAGEPVRARPIGHLRRGWRWCRRNPGAALAAVLVVLSLLTGSSLAVGYAFVAGKERQAAETARGQEAKARNAVQQQLVDLSVTSGLAAAAQNEHAQALLWFGRAAELATNPASAEVNRIRYANWNRHVVQPVRAFRVPGFRPLRDRFRVFEFHPSGAHLLVVTDADQTVIWDLQADTALSLPGMPRTFGAAAWSPDGRWLAVGTSQGQVEVLAFPALTPVATINTAAPVHVLEFSPDGRYLAWGTTQGARVWDCTTQQLATPEFVHPQEVHTLAFNTLGNRLVTSCADRQARVFAVGGGERAEPMFAPVPHRVGPSGVAHGGSDRLAPRFVNRGTELLTATAEQGLVWYEVATGKQVRNIRNQSGLGMFTAMVASPGDRYLALICVQGGIIWDIPGGRVVERWLHRHEWGEDAAFGPAGDSLVTCGADTTARFWSLTPQQYPVVNATQHPLRHPRFVVRTRFAPVGALLATAQWDGEIRVWQVPDADIPDFQIGTGGMTRVALSPDGQHAMASSASFRMSNAHGTRVYNAASGFPAGPPLAAGGLLLDAVFSPDGASVALANSGAESADQRTLTAALPDGKAGSVQVYDWKTGTRRWGPIGLPREPRGLAFSPEGKTLAVICARGQLLLLSAEDGRVLQQIETGQRVRSSVANLWVANGCVRYSPDGRWLVTWEMGDSVQIWNPATGSILHNLPHDDRISDIAFATREPLLLTAGRDTFARVWNLESGQLAGPPLQHPRIVSTARFAAEDNQVISAGEDGTIRLWDWRSGRPLAVWKHHRNLIHDFDITPDNHWIVSTGIFETRVLNRQDGAPLAPTLYYEANNLSVRVSRDGRRALVGGLERALIGFNLERLTTPAPAEAAELIRHAELTAGLRIDPTGVLSQLTSEEWLERWRLQREGSGSLPLWGERPERSDRAMAHTLLVDSLPGKPAPEAGELVRVSPNVREPAAAPPDTPGLELDGHQGRLFYTFAGLPPTEYTLTFWMKPLKVPEGEAFVCDTWHQPWDSPLAVVFENGQLRARIAVGREYATGGVVLPMGRWQHLAVVRSGETLLLYVDGRLRGSARVPRVVSSSSTMFCLGGAPSGEPRCVQARYAGLRLLDQALTPAEIAALVLSGPAGK